MNDRLQKLIDDGVRYWGEGETPNQLARELAKALNQTKAAGEATKGTLLLGDRDDFPGGTE